MSPSNGPTPAQINYMLAHADDDRRPMMLAVHSTFLLLGFVSVALRFGSRIKIGAKLGTDDWFIFVAVVALCGHATACMSTVQWGMGRHAIFATDRKSMSKTSLAATTFYSFTLMFTKLSILALYHRIFHLTRGWVPTLLGFAAFVVALGIIQPLVYILQCIPVSALWTEGPSSNKCVKFGLAIVMLGSIHIITDWLLLFLPIPVVMRLQLNKRAKWSICSLFAVGGVVCIISIVRMVKANGISSVDPTWNNVPIQALSTVEGSIGILAACMPTWRPLFRFLSEGITQYFSYALEHTHRGGNMGGDSIPMDHEKNPYFPHSTATTLYNFPIGCRTPNPVLQKNPPPSPLATDMNHLGPYLDPEPASASLHANPSSPVRSTDRTSWIAHSKRNDSEESVEQMLQGRVQGVAANDVELGSMSSLNDEVEIATAMRVEVSVVGVGMPGGVARVR